MVEKNVGKGRRQRVMSCFILERGSFFPPPGIEKPGLVVPYRQSFEKHSAHYQSLLVHRRIYPRFSTIFHHFEYNGEGEECAARNFPSGKSGKAGEKKIGVDRREITMLSKTIFVIKRVTRKPIPSSSLPFTFHPGQLSTHATFSLGHR